MKKVTDFYKNHENQLKKVTDFFKNYIDVLAFLLAGIIKLYAYGKIIRPIYFSYKELFPPVFASILVICSFSLIFKKKRRASFLYGCNLFITILVVADSIYFSYYRDILNIPVLKNGVMLGAVQSSVTSLFRPIYLLFFIDLLILPHFYVKLSNKENKLRLRLVAFAVMLLIGSSLDGYQIYKLNEAQPRLLVTMFNRIYIAEYIGNLNFHAIDVYNFFSQEIRKNSKLTSAKETEIKSFLKNNSNSNTGTVLNGAGTGKNLIIIQVEALQGFTINTKVNGQEITPNLNRWIKKSAYFDNYYYQTAAGNTSDAEFMTNNSLYPAAEGAAAYIYCGNDFNSLPKALEQKGYTTAAMHGYREDFWNRSVMNKAEGFNFFYGEKSYNINETLGMGLSDKSFLNQSLEKIKQLKQPYFSFLITLSSHYPFNVDDGYGAFDVGEYKDSLLGNYLREIHYTDQQLGMFLDKLDQEGITKNAVIAIYGDHYAIPKLEENSLNKLLNIQNPSELTWAKLQKVPLIIHFPNNENSGVNHEAAGEMDLYPTIANMFNLPNSSMMGRDLYNAKDRSVIFRDGSYTDGNIFYVSQSNSYYNLSSGSKISETTELKDKTDHVTNQLEYSDDILNHDLFKKIINETK